MEDDIEAQLNFEENDGIAESDSLRKSAGEDIVNRQAEIAESVIHMTEPADLKALHQIKDNHSRKVVLTIIYTSGKNFVNVSVGMGAEKRNETR